MSRQGILRFILLLILTSGGQLPFTDAEAAAAAPPSFQGIGFLPGSRFGSFARGISDDGTAVTGNSDQTDLGGSSFMAFRWQAGVMIPLGDLPGGSNLAESGGLSADGSASAGMSFSSNGTEAFRWEGGVMQGLGDLPGGDFYSHAFDISGDGTSVVGLSRTKTSDYPFRWKDGVMINLADDFPGELGTGFARSVSFDGDVVVGLIVVPGTALPFRWTPGLMETIAIPDGSAFADATSVSPDGSVIVGHVTHGFDPHRTEAFRWEGGAMLLLGDLPGGDFQSFADDVSADGSVIVGVGRTAAGEEAIIWTPSRGMRRVRDVLEMDFNLNLTGWRLDSADGVAANGLAIAGSGINPQGRAEAWLAHIGCAASGDVNNDGECTIADVDGFVRCLLENLGCGCADMTADGFVNGVDVSPFVESILE